MNHTHTFKVAGIAILMSLMSPFVKADDTQLGGSDIDAGHFSIGPRATYFNSVGSNDSDWYGGAQVRFHLSPLLALEGSADYRQSDYGANEVDVFPVQANLLLYLMPGKRITPFLLAGPGWYFTNVKGPGVDDTDHRFGFQAGGGLQAFLNKHWSIDTTYRYAWVSDVEARDANLNPHSYDDEGYMITAGLNLHF